MINAVAKGCKSTKKTKEAVSDVFDRFHQDTAYFIEENTL